MPVYTFSSKKTSDVKEYIPANNIPCEDAVTDTGYVKDLINTSASVLGFKAFVLRENIGGFDFSSLCLAVPSSDSAYIQKCKRFFRTVSIFAADCFFCLADTKRAEEYTVFSFHSTGKEIPLCELKEEKKAEYAESIFRLLIKLVYDYSKALRNSNQEYIPLSCLCEDSVYLVAAAENDLLKLRIKILPVFVSGEDKSCLSPKFPMEVWLAGASISSDIYSIAYLYSSLKGGLDESKSLDKLAEDCLNPDEKQRPSIEKLIEAVGETADTSAPVFVSASNTKNDTDDRIISLKPTRKEKNKQGLMTGIIGQIKSFLVTDDIDENSDSNKTRTSEVKKDDQ